MVSATADNRGATIVLSTMARILQGRGLDCEIWCISKPNPNMRVPPGIPFRSLGLRSSGWWHSTTRGLARALAEARPDVVHLHSYTASIHGLRVARQQGLRRVLVSFHDFRLGPRRARVCQRMAPWVDRVVVLNETMRESFGTECGYPPEKLVVLPNAVDTAYLTPQPRDQELAQQWGLRSEDYVIGTLGGMTRIKGQRYLLEALALVVPELPAARLVLVGDGRERKNLEQLARQLGVQDRVIFTGNQSDVRSWLSLMDLYVQPSLIEAHGLAVNEAMAMQLPIIGTDRGGLPEVLGGGEAGLLVPPERPQAMAEAILALARDPARAQALAQAARRRVVDCYNLVDYEEQLWELYQGLLGES